MNVIVITSFAAKADDVKRVLSGEHAATAKDISEDARSRGCVHHVFAEDADGNAVVIDEWDSAQSFDGFFTGNADIPKIVAAVGVTGPPTSTVYRILDTPDRF